MFLQMLKDLAVIDLNVSDSLKMFNRGTAEEWKLDEHGV